MPILNYTTKISTSKTVMEIQKILAKAGAKSINVDYDATGEPEALTFLVKVGERWVNFRLPVNWRGVLERLYSDTKVPKRSKTEDQSRRVAWRITKVWLEAQMAIIDAQQAELAEVFLPYAVSPQTGRTLFQEFKSGKFLLGSGGE
jgi:hypothetical protein